MNFQDFWLGLGLLFISINAEFLDDGVEMEDFEENSEETDVNTGERSSEVRLPGNELQISPLCRSSSSLQIHFGSKTLHSLHKFLKIAFFPILL